MASHALLALPSLEPAGASAPPLSYAQERFWRRREWERKGPVSSVPLLWRLGGPLSVAALRHALAVIVERHEALRTTFNEERGSAVQVVQPAAAPRLPLVDLRALPPAAREGEALRLVRAESCTPFDLACGPLLRLRLFRCAAEEHLLACVLHHVAFDGWSEAIFISELSAVYDACRRRLPSPLPPLPVQVGDHARWQRRPEREARLAGQRAYWRERLRGAAPLDLAALGPGGGRGRPSGKAGSQPVEIAAELLAAVQALGAEARATPAMTLLGAFQAVLSRATGASDVTVTSLYANRAQPGAARLIGNFFSFLPLRVRIDGHAGFGSLLAQVRDATLAAYENADVLYEEVLEEAAGASSGDPVSDFRISFALQSLPAARLAGGSGLAIRRLPLDTGLISQDLTFLLSPAADGLAGRLRYDTGVLDSVLAARLRDGFLLILRHAALDPGRPLDDLPAAGFPPSRGRWRGSA